MIPTKSAAAAVVLVGIAMLVLGFLLALSTSDRIARSTNCNTAFLSVDQPLRNHIPASEVNRVCGKDPRFHLSLDQGD